MKYKVIKAYNEAPQNPIKIIQGEVLTFVEESDPHGDWPNWVYCKGLNKEGWVPKQILEIKETEILVKEDYWAKEHTLAPGEILIPLKLLNGWLWGYKIENPEELAWAPLNYLEKEEYMKNSVFIATSLDGYIAQKDGSVDWLMNVPQPESDEYSFHDFMSRIDALIMGRNTFEQVLTFGDWIYSKKVFVLSSTLKTVPEHLKEKVEIVNGHIPMILEELHKRGFKNFYIDGGKTIQSFLNLDLIDEMIITRVSVLLGEGIPLFESLNDQKDFKIVKTVKLNDYLVTTHFVRDY